MTIREITPHDIGACAALFVEVFASEPWNEAWSVDDATTRLSECASAPHFLGLVAEADGVIQGFAFGNKLRYMQERHYYLLELCIRTSAQGKGMGKLIMEALAEKLRGEGVARIYTLTARDTPPHRFYEKLGFYTSPKMVTVVQRLVQPNPQSNQPAPAIP